MKKLIYCSALLGIGVFSSCSNPDYYNTEDGEEYRKYYVQKLKDDYEASFIKAFGEIPADLTWDLSKYAKETRANELSSDEVGGVTIDVVIGDKSKIHPYMKGGYVEGGTPSELPASPLTNSNGSSVELFTGDNNRPDTDGQNHASYGTDEYTIVSKGEIILSPLWHGNCMKDYYFVVDGFNPKTLTITRYIFSQEDIAALENYSNWNTKKPTSYTEVNTKFSGDKPKGWVFPFAEGTYVDFYLATVDDKNNLVEVGSTIKAYADASKTSGYELYGSATLHQSQNPGYSAIFFLDDTCHRSGRTNNIPGADYDYNDLVVYVAHSQQQYIPDIDEDQEVVTVPGAQKRYMVEDLGASQASDIDFNDIVIDFSESKTYIIKNTYVIENEVKVLVKTDTISTIYGQQAHVHALGGTKELCVYTTGAGGDKLVFRKSTYFDFRKMVNTGVATWDAAAKQIVWDYSGIKYDEKDKLVTNLPVEGWIPDENNIKVVVDDNNYDQYYDATGQLVYTHTTTEGAELRIPAPAVAWDVMFPQMGKAPSIIATNVSQRWNGERMSVFEPCESYFDETLQSYISTNPVGANLNPLFEEAKQGGGN